MDSGGGSAPGDDSDCFHSTREHSRAVSLGRENDRRYGFYSLNCRVQRALGAPFQKNGLIRRNFLMIHR